MKNEQLPEIDEQIRIIKEALKASKQSIVLVGLMAVGKSKLGKRLAKDVGLTFVDTDTSVEDRSGKTVSEIFGPDNSGEPVFRKLEEQAMSDFCEVGGSVISSGGGAFKSDRTRFLVKNTATSIWLNLTPEQTIKRLGKEGIASRPLLANSDSPLETLTKLYRERVSQYAEADVHVPLEDNDNKEESIEQNYVRVINALYTHLRP